MIGILKKLSKFEDLFYGHASRHSCMTALQDMRRETHESLRRRISDLEATLDNESEWFLERKTKEPKDVDKQ
jgi:hypothetical protein